MLSGITTKQVTKVIATWILIEKRNYKQRLLNLKFFPNSHYIEMHDLLYLIKDPICFTPPPPPSGVFLHPRYKLYVI